MNEVVHSVATTTPPAVRTEQALSLRDTRRGASSSGSFSRPFSRSSRRPPLPCGWPSSGSFARRRRQPRPHLFRAHRHHRFGSGQVSTDRQGESDSAGRDRSGGRRPRRQRRAGEGGRRLRRIDRSAAEADVRAASARPSKPAEAEPAPARGAGGGARPRFSRAPGDRLARRSSANLRAREEGVLAADLGQLSATIASFDAQKTQKAAERDMLEQTIATQRNLIATLQKRVDMRTELVASQSGAKSGAHRRDGNPAVSADAFAIHEEELSSATTGLDVIARRLGKSGSGVLVGSGAEQSFFFFKIMFLSSPPTTHSSCFFTMVEHRPASVLVFMSERWRDISVIDF